MRSFALCALTIAVLGGAVNTAHAFEPFAFQVPCRTTAVNGVGTVRPCITCHNNPDGGSGCVEGMRCLNPFGTAFRSNGQVWNEALAMQDSDGDGYSNGVELGDPAGTWRPSQGTRSDAQCACASRPGFGATAGQTRYTPADTDADDDGYCCVGQDTNNNGSCADSGERNDEFDCADDDNTSHSMATELCTDTADNDCNGLPTLQDPACINVVDGDGDGFCPMGTDTNRDRDCIDPGEGAAAVVDCNDMQNTAFPGAQEDCDDGFDNNCDNQSDRADDACTSDRDADDDGYCPLGRDINNDGDCNDMVGSVLEEGEDGDCNDNNPNVNPSRTEICADMLDNDCNGLADFRDSAACANVFDDDGDMYCETGRDTNGNRSCTDAGENEGPGDCNDAVMSINPGAMEICTTPSIDEDCDGAGGLTDPNCVGYLDADDDRYCAIGFDMTNDGDCADEREQSGNGDCDDANRNINPEIDEVCTDGADNDCDGSTDAGDIADCRDYRDVDTDGWCIVGQDMNGDRDCSDAGEQGAVGERPASGADPGTEGDPTVYPMAPENCTDRRDNDLDGMIDEAAYCTRDRDIDGDGYCPIGQDRNGDGDCLDNDQQENQAVTDCDETDATINPGAMERCLEIVDANCDGAWRGQDPECFFLNDRDRDGFCPRGQDFNRDGDCEDLAEDTEAVDCDDDAATVNVAAAEVCSDGVDNDCDGQIDVADSACPCADDAACDDNDACTRDSCMGGRCMRMPDPLCGDAAPLVDGGPMTDDDCNCRAAGASSDRPLGWLLLPLAGALLVWRRRRR